MFISEIGESVARGNRIWGALTPDEHTRCIDVTTTLDYTLKLVRNSDMNYELVPLSRCCGDFMFMSSRDSQSHRSFISFKGVDYPERSGKILTHHEVRFGAWAANMQRVKAKGGGKFPLPTSSFCHGCGQQVGRVYQFHSLISPDSTAVGERLSQRLEILLNRIAKPGEHDPLVFQIFRDTLSSELHALTQEVADHLSATGGDHLTPLDEFMAAYNAKAAVESQKSKDALAP